MAKKRILHIITSLDSGGAERALHQLINSGLKDYADNEVISLRGPGVYGEQLKSLGVRVHCLEMNNNIKSFWVVFRIRRILNRFKPNIIQGWMYHGNMVSFIAWLLQKFLICEPKLVWNIRHSIHDLSKEKVKTRFLIYISKFLSIYPSAIVYNSAVAKQQHEHLGYLKSRGQVIANGFDLKRWRDDTDIRQKTRRLLNINAKHIVIGHVARYHPMKGHGTFIKASALLAKRYPQLHILLCGKDLDLKNSELHNLLVDLPQDRTHYLGVRQDMESIYPAIDLLCQTSEWGEGFPNVLGEAMACGKPCVTTDIGDSVKVIGETGFIVPPGNVEKVVEACSDLIQEIEGTHFRNIETRKRIKDLYSIEKCQKKYQYLYESI